MFYLNVIFFRLKTNRNNVVYETCRWRSDVGRRSRSAHEHTAQGKLSVRTSPGRSWKSAVQETETSGDHFGSQDMRSHTDQDQTGRHHNVSVFSIIIIFRYVFLLRIHLRARLDKIPVCPAAVTPLRPREYNRLN